MIPLCLETLRLLTWCRQERIVLSASHIPGQQNLVADFLSTGKFHREVSSLGLVSTPFCFSTDSSCVPSSVGGLIRLVPRSSASMLLCESGRSRCLGSGCFFHSLVGLPRVCIPSVCSPSESSREGSVRSGIPPSSRSFLAQEALVSSAPVASRRSAEVPSGFSGPSTSACFSDSAPQSESSSSYSLAALRSAGREAGLSVRAANLAALHLRPSSRSTYDSRFGLFVKWCSSRQIDPYHASLSAVADFLIYLFDENRALTTISSFRTAIAAIHRGFPDGSSVSSSVHLTRLLRSFFLSRPPSRTLVSSWSLPAILRALAKPPFEPLARASFHHLTVKTVFLIAIASGQRRSSLHALTLEPGHIRWESAGVRLMPRAGFLAKNQTASSETVQIFLPSLSSHSSVMQDKLWCPVRALKWYVDRSSSLRTSPGLFISTIAPHSHVSLRTISRWIVEAINSAGPDALISAAPRAPDTRGLSTSWALFNGASVDQITRAAYWSNPNSFITCYLRDVVSLEASFGLASLGASASARSNPLGSGRSTSH